MVTKENLFFRKYILTCLGVKGHDICNLATYGLGKMHVCICVCVCIHGKGRQGTNDKADGVKWVVLTNILVLFLFLQYLPTFENIFPKELMFIFVGSIFGNCLAQ